MIKRTLGREILYRTLDEEREYQDKKWGTGFDDKNTPNDWVTYITQYASSRGGALKLNKDEFKHAMVKVASLAIAAIEATERNGGLVKRHYD